MVQFKSNLDRASLLATNLSSAVTPINSAKPIFTATQTTLQGNSKSASLSQKKQVLTNSFCSALRKDIANIHSVASDFEAIDTQLKQQFTGMGGFK
ncbi:TIGR04197 family type VII secretion effector [Carnobacterium gallinarum]|uniref:TIGR04197 family type VII secretion effector n=1 Tax=Carnobacterium gallinarum TaxID=2749 RepID=UPI00055952B7|nr:TIGR04197 family type VII secretion effector [Carnobacterium gallinarum]